MGVHLGVLTQFSPSGKIISIISLCYWRYTSWCFLCRIRQGGGGTSEAVIQGRAGQGRAGSQPSIQRNRLKGRPMPIVPNLAAGAGGRETWRRRSGREGRKEATKRKSQRNARE